MKWLTFEIQRTPGFRLNLTDILFIVIILFISIALKHVMPTSSMCYIPIYVGLTFFMFCNIFRIGRIQELIWYAPFIITSVVCLHYMRLDIFWIAVAIVFEPLKFILIIYTIKNGTYIGAFSRKH